MRSNQLVPRISKVIFLVSLAWARVLFAQPIPQENWIDQLSAVQLKAIAVKEAQGGVALSKQLAPRAQVLASEMRARLQAGEQTPATSFGGFSVFTFTPAGSFWPVLYMRKAGARSSESIPLLNLAQLAKRTGFVDIGGYAVSANARWLAYSIDTSGSRRYQLRLMEISTRRERILSELVSSFDFTPASDEIYLVEMDTKKRPWSIRRLSVDGGIDRVIYSESDERFRVTVSQSASGRYMQIMSASATTSEVHLFPLNRTTKVPQVVLPRREGIYYEADDRDGAVYLRTNEYGGNYGIGRLPLEALGRHEALQPLLRPAKGRFLTAMKVLRGGVVLLVSDSGHPAAFSIDDDGKLQQLPIPVKTATLEFGTNALFDSQFVRLIVQSFAMPLTVVDVPLSGGEVRIVHRATVPRRLNLGAYCEGVWSVPSADGTLLSAPYIYKGRCGETPSHRPLFISVYGAYGANNLPTFSLNRFSLLDRGFVVVLAQVRGGGEGGDDWYHAGRGINKRQGISDFRAVVESLQSRGISSPELTVIAGSSAGGLIVGALVNEAPYLARAAVLNGPFVDVLSTMLNPDLPNTVPEYLEWGNPNDPTQAAYIASYDPIRNIKSTRYPRMLVHVGLHDEQVLPSQAVKYIRALRRHVTNPDEIYLSLDTNSGHDGPADAGRYFDRLGSEFAFILDAVASDKTRWSSQSH
jgi:oligopeptidase B